MAFRCPIQTPMVRRIAIQPITTRLLYPQQYWNLLGEGREPTDGVHRTASISAPWKETHSVRVPHGRILNLIAKVRSALIRVGVDR